MLLAQVLFGQLLKESHLLTELGTKASPQAETWQMSTLWNGPAMTVLEHVAQEDFHTIAQQETTASALTTLTAQAAWEMPVRDGSSKLF